MKSGREHRVPLAPCCIEILSRAKELAGLSEYVFPGSFAHEATVGTGLPDDAQAHEVRRDGAWLRSAFRDWASEQTNYPREVCEMALAHTIPNKTQAAYRRGDLLEKRRDLMVTWSGFATSEEKLMNI